jgi:hypothetical protein
MILSVENAALFKRLAKILHFFGTMQGLLKKKAKLICLPFRISNVKSIKTCFKNVRLM